MAYQSFPYLKDLNSGVDNPLIITKALEHIRGIPKKEYVLSEGRTLEAIAESLYGNQHLWVLLADYNQIVNPLNPPEKVYYVPAGEFTRVSLI